MRRKVYDANLLDTLEQIEGQPFEDDVWRVTWKSRDPLAGSMAGGRWSPEEQFEALYTSLTKDGAIAEAYHHLSLAPVFSSSHNLVNKVKITLTNVLRLNVDQLNKVGVTEPLANRIDYSISQSVGGAAHLLGFQGLIVPSARWNCENLVLFLDHQIDINAHIGVIECEDINWPAWREKVKKH